MVWLRESILFMESKCSFFRLLYLYDRLTTEKINRAKTAKILGRMSFETLIDLEEPYFDGIIIRVKYLHFFLVVFVEGFKEPPPC